MTTQVHYVHLSRSVTAAMAEKGETGIVLLSTVAGVPERRIARVEEFIGAIYDIYAGWKANEEKKIYHHGDFRIVNGRIEHAPFGEPVMVISEPMGDLTPPLSINETLIRLQMLNSARFATDIEYLDQQLAIANIRMTNGINTVMAFPRKQQSDKIRFKWIFTCCKTRDAWRTDGDDLVKVPVTQQFMMKTEGSQMTYAVTDTVNNRARVINIIDQLERVTKDTPYDTELVMKVGYGIDTIGMHGKDENEFSPYSVVLGYTGVAKSERLILALGEEVEYFAKELKKALMWGEDNPIHGVVLERKSNHPAEIFVGNHTKLGG